MAILSAAAVIFSGLWVKARLDSWEYAWRSSEAEASAIVRSHDAIMRALEDSPTPKSIEGSLARVEQINADRKRMDADWVRVTELENRVIAILEHKPFGLPLTGPEREELSMLKQDVQKQSEKKKP